MKAMVLNKTAAIADDPRPLELVELPDPVAGDYEVLLRVSVCGVCHTELDEIEGRLEPPRFPLVLGHQVVGEVIQTGNKVTLHHIGDRVGVGWIDSACGHCRYCLEGNENLCAGFRATGYDNNGGYAEKMVVDERFAYAVPSALTDIHTAPLLCAGAIGYRSLRLSGLKNGDALGLTGFGASAHLVLQMARHLYPDSKIYVFARNPEEREFALQLGAIWAGNTTDTPPELLFAIIDTTPVWMPILAALERLAPGGRLVINAIRKESIDKDVLLGLDYPGHLWQEKEIKSVANVARNDVIDFLALADELEIQPEVECYKLEDANRALVDLKNKRVRGAKVLVVNPATLDL